MNCLDCFRYFECEWTLFFGDVPVGEIEIYSPKVPQQPNGFDCGLFVLQSMDEIRVEWHNHKCQDLEELFTETWYNPLQACNLRKVIKDNILSIMKE